MTTGQKNTEGSASQGDAPRITNEAVGNAFGVILDDYGHSEIVAYPRESPKRGGPGSLPTVKLKACPCSLKQHESRHRNQVRLVVLRLKTEAGGYVPTLGLTVIPVAESVE